MKPYTPETNIGRTRGGDDIHHRTADQPRSAARKAAKASKHAARQASRRAIRQGELDLGAPPRGC